MDTPDSGALSRRDLLAASVATLAGLMFESMARAAAPRHGTAPRTTHAPDPRRAFADRLCDLVIPATDTPGAAQAKAADFVLMALDARMGSMEPAQLERVRTALDAAPEAGGRFLALPHARQHELLAALDARSYAAGQGAPGHAAGTAESDWPHLKAAILAGYYTSEIGASRELVFDPVPGTRENIKLTPAFRMFSNQGFGGVV